jgi:hypothetical protein
MAQRIERRGGSPFWALLLIGIGLVWLLGQAGILSGANIAVLFRMWPVLLIGLGLNLLIGRNSSALSTLIILGTILVMVVLMLIGPSIGLVRTVEAQEATYNEPLENTTSATMSLGLGVGRGTISALEDSNQLIMVDSRYVGDLTFETHNQGAHETVTLSSRNEGTDLNFDFFGWTVGIDDDSLYTNIGLAPGVALDLEINSGVGENTLDLSDLTLMELDVNGGVGKTTLTLPPTSEQIPVQINSGVGEVYIIVPEGALFDADINGGVGKTDIDLPEGAAVRVEATRGLGGLNIGAGLERTGGSDDHQIWETPNYDDATNRITINYDGGVGELIVR